MPESISVAEIREIAAGFHAGDAPTDWRKLEPTILLTSAAPAFGSSAMNVPAHSK
jgi:hypothetical protein